MKDNRQVLTVVVSGTPVQVEASANASVRSVVPEALHKSGQVGRPEGDWELRDEAGNLLGPERKVGEFGPDAMLYLSLKVGSGG